MLKFNFLLIIFISFIIDFFSCTYIKIELGVFDKKSYSTILASNYFSLRDNLSATRKNLSFPVYVILYTVLVILYITHITSTNNAYTRMRSLAKDNRHKALRSLRDALQL